MLTSMSSLSRIIINDTYCRLTVGKISRNKIYRLWMQSENPQIIPLDSIRTKNA